MNLSGNFFGTELTHDQCWDLYEEMLAWDEMYDMNESGYSQAEVMAFKDAYYAHCQAEVNRHYNPYRHSSLDKKVFIDKDAAFEQMTKDMQDFEERYAEYMPVTEEESDFYHSIHHLMGKDKTPEWKIASDKISQLLGAK